MESLVINIVIGSFLILFAAMAIFPLVIGGSQQPSPRRQAASEDRLIRLEHKAIIERRGEQPALVPVPSTDGPHRSHRTAA